LNLFDDVGLAVCAPRILGECNVIMKTAETLFATAACGVAGTVFSEVASAAIFADPGWRVAPHELSEER
jgi:hypothetical protein